MITFVTKVNGYLAQTGDVVLVMDGEGFAVLQSADLVPGEDKNKTNP